MVHHLACCSSSPMLHEPLSDIPPGLNIEAAYGFVVLYLARIHRQCFNNDLTADVESESHAEEAEAEVHVDLHTYI